MRLAARYGGIYAEQLAADAAGGRFGLPVCQACGMAQYPLREVCSGCGGTEVAWEEAARTGVVQALTILHHSNDAAFAARLPLTLGSVTLDCGPTAVVFLNNGCEVGDRVELELAPDAAGRMLMTARRDGRRKMT